MQSSSRQEQAVPRSYRQERDRKTLSMGRLFVVIAVVSVVIFALRDTMVFRTRAFVIWGSIGLVPVVAYLICSLTICRAKGAVVVPLHSLSLLGLMVTVCGYTYASFLLSEGKEVLGGNSPLVLVTALFFVFIFASGARPYFAFVVLPPLALLTIALLVRGVPPVSVLTHLSSAWVFAVASVAAGFAQERVLRNEFTMRSLAHKRKDELESEVARVRELNDRLEKEIEERKVVEAELEKRAAMDELTDVYNRRAGMEILTQSLYLAQRNKQPLSVCFVDVDDLKVVNDNFGHSEGDHLLQQVITILKKHLRKSDYVSRIGGDEFLMVLPNCTQESADYIIERIKDDLTAGNGAEKPYPVTISTGVAEYSGDREVVPQALVNEADENMYRSKQAKKHSDHSP